LRPTSLLPAQTAPAGLIPSPLPHAARVHRMAQLPLSAHHSRTAQLLPPSLFSLAASRGPHVRVAPYLRFPFPTELAAPPLVASLRLPRPCFFQTSNQSALKPGFTPPPLLTSVSPQSSAPLIALKQPAAAMAINGHCSPGRRPLSPSSPYKVDPIAPAVALLHAPTVPHLSTSLQRRRRSAPPELCPRRRSASPALLPPFRAPR
jgi:hypothetical protein